MPTISKQFFIALAGGLTLAASWLVPGTIHGALLGWCSVLFLAIQAYQPSYVYTQGAVAYAIAFSWLTYTIATFGGFPDILNFFTFLLFVFGSAVQFIIFSYSARLLRKSRFIGNSAIAFAWIFAEVCMFRIFPWSPGHSQFAFQPFALGAALGGVPLITFTMFWVCSSLLRKSFKAVGTSLLLLCSLLLFGFFRGMELEKNMQTAEQLRVAVVQANTSIEERSNRKFFGNNRLRYTELSKEIPNGADLIIWPEGVVQDWISDEITHVRADARLPYLGPSSNFLIGAMTYTRDRRFFNSAMGIQSNGEILPLYHKQILMPFGEYLPFSSIIGKLGHLSEMIGGLSAGDKINVMNFSGNNQKNTPEFQVSPLICYEDVLPRLAAQSSRAGANLLVNLTNDAWFGKSKAPLQHQLIANFRSIENGKVLIRSTNSGLSSVVLPDARIAAQIPMFEEHVLSTAVPLLHERTFFTVYHMEFLPTLLALLVALLVLESLIHERRFTEKRKSEGAS